MGERGWLPTNTSNQTQVFELLTTCPGTRLNFKMVVSHAINDIDSYNGGTHTNKSLSARSRVMLLF